MPKKQIEIEFEPGDTVTIDEDKNIIATVVQVCIQSSVTETTGRITYQVDWFHNGAVNSAWFDAYLLNTTDI